MYASTSTSLPHSFRPFISRTSTLPRSSRATTGVSRSKNDAGSTGPAGTATLDSGPKLLAGRPPAALVDVEVLVGAFVHRLPVHAGPPCADADAELHGHRKLLVVEVLERIAHAGRNIAGVALIRFRHRDAKLVAAQPAARVSCADRPLQFLCEDPDGLIAHMVAICVVDVLEVVEVDHHQGQAALVSLSVRHRAVHRALELRPVGEAGQIVGAGFLRVLARAVERDRDLIRHRGDKFEVAGLKRARQARGYRHRYQQHTLRAQLGADRAPLSRDAVDARLRWSGGNLHHAQHPGATRLGKLFFLAWLHADRLGELEARAFPDPHRPGLQAEHLERLPQPDFSDLRDIERAAKRAGDVIKPVELALPRAVADLGVVEIAMDEVGVQMLDDIAKTALREQQHLVGVVVALDLLG